MNVSRTVAIAVGILALGIAGCQGGRKPEKRREEVAPAPATRLGAKVLNPPRDLRFEDDFPLPSIGAVELGEAGAKPRARRRYALTSQPGQLAITASLRVVEIINGERGETATLPQISYGLGFSTVSDSDAGKVAHFFATPAAITDIEGKSEQAQELAKAQVALFQQHVEKRRGSVAIDDRGGLGKVEFIGKQADARTLHAVEQLFIEAVIPLPSEAIGVGATWRQVTLLRRGLHAVKQTATYRLVAANDDLLRVAVAINQLGEPQLVNPADLPPGTGAELIILRWQAAGELDLDLTRPTPSGQLAVTLTVHGRIQTQARLNDVFTESEGTLTLINEPRAPTAP